MCEFVTKFFVENTKIQTKYRVISFEFETSHCWFFNVTVIGIIVHGKFYEKDQPVKLIGFPKRRQVTEKNETYEVECMPPCFYDEMRNKAIDDGRVKGLDYDSPRLEDRALFT